MSKKRKVEDTLDHKWCRENSDRLASFEILKRFVKHETKVPMSHEDLYDKIGVSEETSGLAKAVTTESTELMHFPGREHLTLSATS
jgi:hypothetical protein